jgi:hypothetical protein
MIRIFGIWKFCFKLHMFKYLARQVSTRKFLLPKFVFGGCQKSGRKLEGPQKLTEADMQIISGPAYQGL